MRNPYYRWISYKATRMTNLIMYTTIAAILGSLISGTALPTASGSNEGDPGGPRQIPGEDLGCHFPNPYASLFCHI
jgi:hypothetical protein